MQAFAVVYERRLLRTHDDGALKVRGLGGMNFLYCHFENHKSLSGSKLGFEEAKSQYMRLKFEMRSAHIFSTDFNKFWV